MKGDELNIMQLTREQAIFYHRDMWNWIADEIEKAKSVLSVIKLKEEYCKRNMFNVLYSCFLCDYTNHECYKCPLKWNSIPMYNMCEHLLSYGDMKGIYCQCKYALTWQKQAALARKIANLTERTDV